MSPAPKARSPRRVQYAALPYRQRQDGEIQIRLITSRETRRWVIPKGWPMKGLSPAKAAAREAYEEAGLLGSIAGKPLGLYTYEKRLALRSVLCDVLVFPLKVKRYVKTWPERSERFGFWFSVESAAAAVQEEDLRTLILAFGDLMAERFAAKRSMRKPAESHVTVGSSPAAGAPVPSAAAKGAKPAKRKAEAEEAAPGEAQAPKTGTGKAAKAKGRAGEAHSSEAPALPKTGRAAAEGGAAGKAVKAHAEKSGPARAKSGKPGAAKRTGQPQGKVAQGKVAQGKAAKDKSGGAGPGSGPVPGEAGSGDTGEPESGADKAGAPVKAERAVRFDTEPDLRPVAERDAPRLPLLEDLPLSRTRH